MSDDTHASELSVLIAEFEASGMAELHLQTKSFELQLLRDLDTAEQTA